MESRKICPLLSVDSCSDSHCRGDACAWWVPGREGRCALVALADNTASIQQVADNLVDLEGVR